MVLMSHALGRSIEDVTMLTAYQLLACGCYGYVSHLSSKVDIDDSANRYIDQLDLL